MTTQLPNELPLDNDFWQFSLLLWKNKTAQEILLKLQDRDHLRVNLLLFSMWLGIEQKDIHQYILNALETTESWHQKIVTPLRLIRKSLPVELSTATLKPQVQTSELLAEQIEQALLFKSALNNQAFAITKSPHDSSNKTLSILINNLLRCSSHAQSILELNKTENRQNTKKSTLCQTDLLLLVQACLPMHSKAQITACLESHTNSKLSRD